MAFNEELILLVVDKGLIAGIAALVWFAYSQRQKIQDRAQFRNEQPRSKPRGINPRTPICYVASHGESNPKRLMPQSKRAAL